MTTIERLRAEFERVTEQYDALGRRRDEIDLAIAEAEGDRYRADYVRARLAGDSAETHRAWLALMAHYRADPRVAAERAAEEVERVARTQAEITAEVERLRSESASGAQGEAG